MNESDVMVYLMTGFLDSGKTQFLDFTLKQDYFQIDGKTLLILCEEGEEEYNPMELLKYGVVIGRATKDIPRGTWVHLHCMRSLVDERSSHLDTVTGAPNDISYE